MGGAPSSLNSDAEPSPSETKKDPPHMFDEIMKLRTADPKPTQEDARSSSGILLDEKKMKYWVDGQNNNCFMIYPRDLSIIWCPDKRYWSYEKDTSEESDPNLEVAVLLNVCWLEINGKLELSYLNPDVAYEVFFEIKLNGKARGWDSRPVDLRLKLPQGRVQERKENFDKKPKNKWLLLKVGDIQTQRGSNGDVVITLFQNASDWKKGLIVKGILITPKE